MVRKKFQGTGVALVTPFLSSGKVDYKSLERLINFVIENKVDYLVSLGTTGESVTLNKEEKKEVLQFTINVVRKRVPLIVGIGGNNTQEIIDTINDFSFKSIEAILSVSPYYNKPSQEGIYRHYMELDKITPLPIILYNVPGRTNSNISPETTLRLARDGKNIIGIKEASGNLEQCMEIVKNKPKHFLVISGDDILTLPMISFGMDGVISVVANAFPKDFSEMVRLSLNGDFKKATQLHFKLMKITELLFADGNPGGVKAALEILGICKNELRLPLVSVNENVYKKINLEIKRMK